MQFSSHIIGYYIGYHVYADDTQIYVSFNSDDPSQALDKINVYVFRIWEEMDEVKQAENCLKMLGII